jgi:hypothetical protein
MLMQGLVVGGTRFIGAKRMRQTRIMSYTSALQRTRANEAQLTLLIAAINSWNWLFDQTDKTIATLRKRQEKIIDVRPDAPARRTRFYALLWLLGVSIANLVHDTPPNRPKRGVKRSATSCPVSIDS